MLVASHPKTKAKVARRPHPTAQVCWLKRRPRTPQEALAKAIQVVGDQVKLCAILGPDIKTGHVYHWLNKAEEVPARYSPTIERATRELGNPVLCEQLTPSTDWAAVRGVAEAA